MQTWVGHLWNLKVGCDMMNMDTEYFFSSPEHFLLEMCLKIQFKLNIVALQFHSADQ